MGVRRCRNGHYYDDSKYSECPYCDGMANFNSVTIPLDTDQNNPVPFNDRNGVLNNAGRSDSIHRMAQNRMVRSDLKNQDDLRTESADMPGDSIKSDRYNPANAVLENPVKDAFSNQIKVDNRVIDKIENDREVTSEEREEDKFCIDSPRKRMENEDDGKTIGFYDSKDDLSPVVGWLVCIKGPSKGKDYRIIPERNFIGRDKSNDISLDQDERISREKHAIISYNPKNSQFMLIAGDVHGIIYLNGEEIYTNAQLKAGDVIEIGKTTLKFIPFCTEEFIWDRY